MPTHRIEARPPRGEPRRLDRLTTGDDLAVYLQDAAHTPGGTTPAVVFPRTEADVAALLREAPAALAVGAQSSLTGGATPFGEWVVSLARMDAIGPLASDRVRVQAGVPLLTLEEELRRQALFYPPAPTFRGATIGGTAATNAAGAATFKYGSTRRWVRALTVVLASGDVLDIERGQVRASPEGFFAVALTNGEARRVRVPTYAMPRVPKRSAGYHAEAGMDLVDLFIGSEGTLGVVTEVDLGLIPEPDRFYGLVSFDTEARSLELVRRLREASRATWESHDPRGIDIAAIESLDRRCIEMLREDGRDREHGVRLPQGAEAAILFQAELRGVDGSIAADQIARFEDPDAVDTPLTRLCRLLRDEGILDSLEIALPHDRRRAAQIEAVREAVPMCVNHRIGALQRAGHPLVRKTAADMIVPFERLSEAMDLYRRGFARRGLDHALWGHVSDGNIHANVIPRRDEDVRSGEEAILEFGIDVARLGGCPLSEHGVGRNAVKQELLRRLYGDAGIGEMRRVKAALDPEWKLAPGVLFARPGSTEPSR